MKKSLAILTSALLTVSLFLTACGGSTTPTETTPAAGTTTVPAETTTPDETTAAVSGEPVKITLMQSKTEIQNDMQTVIDAFNAGNHGVEVELLGTSGDNFATVLQSNFAADPANAPTIFSMSGPDTEKFQQFMAELDDTAAAKILADGVKSSVTVDGKIMGLPSAVEGYGLIYNVDMFNAAGIDPASLTDMDKFVAALETLNSVDGVDSPIGFAKENYFVFVHFFNWGVALDEDYAADIAKVNAGEMKLADIPTVKQWADDLTRIAPYTNQGLVSYDDQVAGFSAGKYAMIHQGVWAQQVLNQNEVDFAYDFLPYPTSGNDSMPVGPATAWRVNNKAGTEQQTAAKTFLDWLITSDEGQNFSADLLNFIPAYENIKAPAGALTESVAKNVTDGKTIDWAFNSVFPAGIDVDGTSAIQKFYAGQSDASQLLEEINEAWVRNAE